MGIMPVPLTVGHLAIGQITGINQQQVPKIEVIVSSLQSHYEG